MTGLPGESTDNTSLTTALYDGNLTTLAFNTTFNNESTTLTKVTQATPFRGRLGFGELENYDEFWAAYYINTYYLWPVVAVGILGNIAALVTIRYMGHLTSPLVYMLTLAVSDILALVVKLMYHQFTLKDYEMGPWGCRSLRFLGTYFTETSNWILVVMTLERTVAIWFPLKVAQHCTKRNAFIVIFIIGLSLCLLNLFVFWYITDSYNSTIGLDCGIEADFKEFVGKYWYWIDGVFYTILPCLIILPCNGFIVYGLRNSKTQVKQASNSTQNKAMEKGKQQRQMTIMLVSVSIVFIVLTLPNAVFFAVETHINFQETYFTYARYMLITQVVHLLSDSNHALNFFMYFMAGTKFRHAFLRMFSCKNTSKYLNRPSHPTVSYTMSSRETSSNHNESALGKHYDTKGNSLS